MAEQSELDKLANGNGVKEMWTRIFTGVKSITGAVNVTRDGTLQAQIDSLSQRIKDITSAKEEVDQLHQDIVDGTVYANVLCEDGTTVLAAEDGAELLSEFKIVFK